jgi:ArsR family transcriptional regulator, virulence genes transcriptional regulator
VPVYFSRFDPAQLSLAACNSVTENAGSPFTPNLRKMSAAGQNPVKDACSMLAPTNAVRTSQYELTSHASATLMSTMLPARKSTARSILMTYLLSTDLREAQAVSNLQIAFASPVLTIYSYIRIYASMKMDMSKMLTAADDASGLLKALANRHRLIIICQLTEQERSVGELAALLNIRDSTVSQHLSLLRKDGLVTARRDGQTIWYSIGSPQARELARTLYRIYCPPTAAAAQARHKGRAHLAQNQ